MHAQASAQNGDAAPAPDNAAFEVRVSQWCARRLRSVCVVQVLQRRARRNYQGWVMQTVLCTRRALLQHLKQPQLVILELGMHLLCATVVGMAFTHENWVVPGLPPSYLPYCPDVTGDNWCASPHPFPGWRWLNRPARAGARTTPSTRTSTSRPSTSSWRSA